MKLFFYGSEMVSQSEYPEIEIVNSEEMKYLCKVEECMLAVINQYGITGLSAPQLGFPMQMIVVRLAGGKKLTLLNPKIERMYGAETDYPEGCISCPPGGNYCPTARMQFINVVASTIEEPDRVRDWQFTSGDARKVQHEVDHLKGTFFLDRASVVDKAKVLEQFHQWKRTFKQDGTGFPCGGNGHGRSTSTQAQHS
jgi:peptide deformylase